ncbi:PDDEXK nuclease domain-containing protein [Clavibacter sp. Sh2036]|uniref:PDDEXK nuclease domain-containing protein n=1 Tax=Clavibacter sp. Sh2036 TaxID=3397677 RepID=UPI0039E1ACAB
MDLHSTPTPTPPYEDVLAELKGRVHAARHAAQRRVNTELVILYWRIGATLARQSDEQAWGSGVISRLAADLRAEFPEMKGFSPRNLIYMRSFARAWPDPAIAQRPVAQLPWGHVTVLLSRVDEQADRDWYASRSVSHGWSRNVLEHHIRTRLHERSASAPTNFDRALDAEQSDLARQLTKDPYVLDFLAVDGDAAERELERALVDRIIDTLRELGEGFSFVGRQVHFDVDGDDFFVDLLFFHVEQLRYVVIELKTGRFRPEQLGQLGFYVALVDDRLRRAHHADTVGLLLVAGKTDAVVRYSLAGQRAPVAVSSYDLLPEAERAALPSEAVLARAVRDPREPRTPG